MSAKYVKKRNWAFVLYPESAPEDWRDKLQQTGLPCAISPLHDKDIDPTGAAKKAHYHVIICYPGPSTYNTVKSLTDALNQPIPQPLEAIGGYYRYLTHKDNPDKAQYDEAAITSLNGFNILDYQELSRRELTQIKLRLQQIIRDAGITEYAALMDLLQDSGMVLEYDVASSHTIFFNSYIRSRRCDTGASV